MDAIQHLHLFFILFSHSLLSVVLVAVHFGFYHAIALAIFNMLILAAFLISSPLPRKIFYFPVKYKSPLSAQPSQCYWGHQFYYS